MNSAGKSIADAALRATERGAYTEALKLYAEAVRLTPRHPVLLYNYASLARITGDLDLALTLLNQVIELNPADSAAWHMRSNLRRWSRDDNHIAALTAQLATTEGAAPPATDRNKQEGQPLHCKDDSDRGGSPKQRVDLHYALAKEHEDCGNYAEAKRHLLCGAALRRSHLRYNLQDDLDTMAALTAFAEGAAPAANSNKKKEGQPPFSKSSLQCKGSPFCGSVFIVGLPRVGSTLLERMLSCDNRVQAAGELPYFPQLIGRALQQAFIAKNGPKARPKSKTELVSYAANINWKKLGEDYQKQLPKGQVIIDKLPLNFLNIAFIQKALPNAKIIYMHRDQQDHELALMKNLFNHAYPWSYKLSEIRKYYHAAKKLCESAIEQSENNIHRLSYEDLVSTPAQALKKVADYCGLNWQEQDLQKALQFNARNRTPSTTGSASQIRVKLHQRSVGLASKYEWPATEVDGDQINPPF